MSVIPWHDLDTRLAEFARSSLRFAQDARHYSPSLLSMAAPRREPRQRYDL
jgi:hypothetical protein